MAITTEPTINATLGNLLEGMGKRWQVFPESRRVLDGGGQADIVICEHSSAPLVIECEVNDASNKEAMAEAEAASRLGKNISNQGLTINAAIALLYPPELRDLKGRRLQDELKKCKFKYALLTGDGKVLSRYDRFPAEGWMEGNIFDLAILLHRGGVPAYRIESLAKELESGLRGAVDAFNQVVPHESSTGNALAKLLGQPDDEDDQTRHMAMTLIVDALVFHEMLCNANLEVPENLTDGVPMRRLRTLCELRVKGNLSKSEICKEWELILKVNYYPIFKSALEIVKLLAINLATTILNALLLTAERMLVGGVAKSHDLTGVVFQKLISDRKFLATFYTRPASAALLAGLALPTDFAIDWVDADTIGKMRIGDFACGTGTLLSIAYRRLGLLHEVHGGDPAKLHANMMREGLVGLDVLNSAVHLTASMLAGMYPEIIFSGECLLTMPYGRQKIAGKSGVCVGSLDLLDESPQFDIFSVAARTAGDRGEEDISDYARKVNHESFDLVIMNPPFSRHAAREGDRADVHNVAFAAFGADEKEQNEISAHLKKLAKGGCGHGDAGMGTHFIELGHRKIKQGGTMAMVLPLSSLVGMSWSKVRELWRDRYNNIMIVTIAGKQPHESSFSANTGIAECLFIGVRGIPKDGKGKRALFVVMHAQPKNTLEGEQLATSINEVVARGNIRKLEDGPVGGQRVVVGDTTYAEILNAPIPYSDESWKVLGIQDLTLAQTAYQLESEQLWIAGMPKAIDDLPLCRLKKACSRVGLYAFDIMSDEILGNGLPRGPFEIVDGCKASDTYPALWNSDATKERQFMVACDSHCRHRQAKDMSALIQHADNRWKEGASRIHFRCEARYNSGGLLVAMTDRPSVGGGSWPTVLFDDERHEYAFALWWNSTLGLLCHWWMANKSQTGRGRTSVTAIPNFVSLSVRALSDAQLAKAEAVFKALAKHRFLPFNQLHGDASRAELDRRLLVDILGLPSSLCDAGGAIPLLREKLAGEPQIHAGKKSRVVFTKSGETSEKMST